MTFEALRSKLSVTFKEGFISAPGVAWLPTEFENHPFTIPASSWCRFSIVEGQRDNAAVGKRFQRTVGVIFLQIFSPEGSGTKIARQAADKLAVILDNKSIPVADGQDITIRPVSFTPVGLNKDGWYQSNASAPFWFDVVAPSFDSEELTFDDSTHTFDE